ncbi:hypothetical protein EDD11_007462 [Mortierella claussenii]|nr:hypothetical protein EDD11_007462 [Mortierella claussenii]
MSPSSTAPSTVIPRSSPSASGYDPAVDPFFDFEPFQRLVPPASSQQKKEALLAQHQRREQIILMLQQQQIDAQEKARQEKLEKQQAKLERKQRRSEMKQIYQAQYAGRSSKEKNLQERPQKQHSLPIYAYPDEPTSPHLTDSQLYASNHSYHHDSPPFSLQLRHDQDGLSSSSSSTTSGSSRKTSDRMRSLSLKSTTKSMYDLPPWSGGPQLPAHEYHVGYDGDENQSGRSHGWDSLMDTLRSPTLSSPSDALWDLKDETELDMMDSMSALTLGHGFNDNGDGRYLLVLGANGRTGIELVKQGLDRNYRVTAFVRDDKALLEDSLLRKNQNLIIVRGSPTSQADMDRCVEGQDVVVNVIGARLMANDTIIGSHSQVVLNNALKKHGVRRLIVVTSYGCLGLRNYLINTKRLFSRVFMTGILKDKVLQEDIVQRDSEHLDWTIVRPITLKDGDLSEKYYVSSDELPKTNKVKMLSRKDLAHYILTIINRPHEYGAVRSIAGKPKSSKPKTSCPPERRRDGQDSVKQQHQDFTVRVMQEKKVF